MLQSLDTESMKTLVHAFMSSHIDYCNTMLARSPMSTTDRIQRVPNVAARVAVVLGSSTMAWCSYVTLSCTGWMFFNVSTIRLEKPFTGVFKAECPSTLWTAEHLLRMLPAVSIFALPATTRLPNLLRWCRGTMSWYDIVIASSVIRCLLLSAWWPATLYLTISMTHYLVMTSLGQHWKHTFLKVSEHARNKLQAFLHICAL